MLIVDGGLNPVSGLSMIGGKPANENVTAHRGPLLPPLVPTKLSLIVRRGDIRFDCDGRQIFHWMGDVSELTLDPDWKKRIPNNWDLFVMAQGVCLIKEMKLTPLR